MRWSFRTKLAVTIAAVFIVAGLGLLTVQYLLVSQLFGQAVATSTNRVVQDVMCTDAATSMDRRYRCSRWSTLRGDTTCRRANR